jgi:hypothetical protein
MRREQTQRVKALLDELDYESERPGTSPALFFALTPEV